MLHLLWLDPRTVCEPNELTSAAYNFRTLYFKSNISLDKIRLGNVISAKKTDHPPRDVPIGTLVLWLFIFVIIILACAMAKRRKFWPSLSHFPKFLSDRQWDKIQNSCAKNPAYTPSIVRGSHGRGCLLHWGRAKMDDISRTTSSNIFSWKKIFEFRINIIWLKFIPRGPIDNDTPLVQVMAWHQTGDKPLSVPVMV